PSTTFSTLSLPDALPISLRHLALPGLVEPAGAFAALDSRRLAQLDPGAADADGGAVLGLGPFSVGRLHRRHRHRRQRVGDRFSGDRKSTRLNSSHRTISY